MDKEFNTQFNFNDVDFSYIEVQKFMKKITTILDNLKTVDCVIKNDFVLWIIGMVTKNKGINVHYIENIDNISNEMISDTLLVSGLTEEEFNNLSLSDNQKLIVLDKENQFMSKKELRNREKSK